VLGINGSPPAVYLNNGTANPFQNVSGVFVSPPPGPTMAGISWGTAVMVDVNADGHPDLAIAGFNAPDMIYLNNGTSTPVNGVSGIAIGTQDVAYAPAFGDVNGDGFLDMAVASTNHVPSRLYLTHGAPLTSGTYSTVQIGTDVGYGQDVRIADVNGDGKPDLILTYIIASTVGTDPTGIAIYGPPRPRGARRLRSDALFFEKTAAKNGLIGTRRCAQAPINHLEQRVDPYSAGEVLSRPFAGGL